MSEEHLLQTEQTAANETAVLQTEIPFYALKLIQKQRALEEEINDEILKQEERKLKTTDEVKVVGHLKSLMYSIRDLEINFTTENLDITNRYYALLALNSIVVLHDKKYLCWLNFNDVEQKDLQDRFKPPQLPITIFTPFQGGLIAFCDEMSLKNWQEYFMAKSTCQKKILMMTNICKVLCSDSINLQSWRNYPNLTLVIRVWADIFETLFSDTIVNLVWVNCPDDPFKIILRINLKFEHKTFDVSNISFVEDNENQKSGDMTNTLLTGKAILNNLMEQHDLGFKQATIDNTFVAEVRGLEMFFIHLQATASGCYMVSKLGKSVQYPRNETEAKSFINENMGVLFTYKYLITREARVLYEILKKKKDSPLIIKTSKDFLNEIYSTQQWLFRVLSVSKYGLLV